MKTSVGGLLRFSTTSICKYTKLVLEKQKTFLTFVDFPVFFGCRPL